MSLAVIYSRAQLGIDAPLVRVEVHITGGLPSLAIVGLPEAAVRESKDRVRSALLTSRFDFPQQRITVNLAPADLPKDGGRFDLPIALGILAASKQIPSDALADHEFLGELALGGELRPVRGVLPGALAARDADHVLVLASDDAAEARLARNGHTLPAAHLLGVCAHLKNAEGVPPPNAPPDASAPVVEDLCDVHGQYVAKRALEVAAAGEHHLLMMGPPGTGKTMLATRLPGILPEMTEAEALESAAVRSVGALRFDPRTWAQRPFRAPHHSASGVALVGGGGKPRPGEISLAHNGVLFLDEFPEFDRRALEGLREPLECGRITISRAARQAEFPARFQLVAAMNPCPCGQLGARDGACHCSVDQIRRYRARISGPLLDRIDLQVEVPRTSALARPGANTPEAARSACVRARVQRARERQIERAGHSNQRLRPAELARFCPLDKSQARLLEQAETRLGLSARARDRILRVARTIADLAGAEHIDTAHLGEAIAYRSLDRTAPPPAG